MQPTLTLHQFNQLGTLEKYKLLEDAGIYLEVFRLEGKYKVALFYLFGYYVEVWLDQTRDQLLKASAFSSYKKLDPYLDQINILPLFSLL